MLAVRFHGAGDVRVDYLPRPRCDAEEVLVKIAYAGICGSDLHVFRKGMFVTTTPVIMGHEFSGIVEEVGLGVTALKVGDHVIGDPRVTCGSCPLCTEGSYNLCPDLGFIGEVAPGCFAEYLALRADRLLRVPKSIDLKNAALVEPLAVALHIAETGRFTKEDSVGIVGAGPIGLLTLMVARVVNKVRDITLVDISESRLRLAQSMGAHNILNSIPGHPSKAVDVVVEAVGLEETLTGAVKWLKPRGRLVLAGLYEDKVQLEPNEIINKELRLGGINAYGTKDLVKAIEILGSDILDVSPVVSQVMPMEATVSAFGLLTSRDQTASKILLASGA